MRVLFVHSSAGGYGADRQLRLLATSIAAARVLLPFEGPLAEDLLRGTFDGKDTITVRVEEVDGKKRLHFEASESRELVGAT